ncbi:MAG: response regulator, partial [Sphingomonadales bacterium]|nr:response regulator [Sphingomonadales bacterium]
APAPAPGRALEVLVVEDNTINRTVLCEMLRRAGHRPSEARNGQEGVDLALAQRFDLIMMDMNMPVLNGIEATAAIRAAPGPSRMAPIYAVTANVLPEARAQLEAAGVTQVLTKPITRTGLVHALAALAGPAPPPAPQGTPLIDEEVLTDLIDALGPAGFAETRALFLADGEKQIAEMTRAAEAGDFEAHGRAAHRLAGAAALMGAARLRRLLGTLENEARAQAGARIAELLPDLAPLWRESSAALCAITPAETAAPPRPPPPPPLAIFAQRPQDGAESLKNKRNL